MQDQEWGITRRQACAGLVGVGGGTLLGTRYLSPANEAVSILAAGSLSNALETTFPERVDSPLAVETHGSARIAQLVASGQKTPDIVAVADVSLFDSPLDPPWYAEFASNELVVAYNGDTEGGRAIAEAGTERWYEPLLSDDARLGRTDPNLDPLGYRTLFLLELASRYYGVEDLSARLLSQEQVYPETQLVSQLETGGIDAAVTYRNMAVERDYDYVELPPELNFGSPDHAERWYESVSWTLPSGKTVRGGLISYGATLRDPAAASADVFDALVSPSYLEAHGFDIPESYPRYHGDVPDRLAE